MKKRGQISSFVILGIVIVVLFAVGVVYRAEIIDKLTELQIIKGVALPPEAQKVNDFVVQCLKDRATEGIGLLGLQGGYIELPAAEIPQGNINIFSNKLTVLPGLRTAYWYYQKDNGISVGDVPSKDEMSQNLENYLNANIKECFEDFSTFPNYNIDYRNPSTEVNIKNNEVQVTLNMPTVIDIKGQRFNIQTFRTRVNVALGELTDIAKQILDNEIASNYLEEKTIDMMVAYDNIPYSGSDLTCGVKTWQIEKVISDFKTALAENMPQFRIAFTDYELPSETHSYFEWQVTKKRYENVNAVLYYSKSWPFYIDIAPKENGMLKAQQITDKMGDIGFIAKNFFCMNDWNFVYDVKYPVLVSLYDQENDYTFQFAMQVVLERNQPRKAEIVPDFEVELDRKYCENTRVTKSTVYTYEEALDGTVIPLDNTEISYKCINHLCYVGTTAKEGEDALLSTEFPSCVGGTVIAEKEGYHRAQEIDLNSNEEFSLSLTLEKIIDKPVKIQVNRKGGGSSEPTDDEQVIIELREEEKEYNTMVIYPDQKEISLIPGDYNVKIYIVKTGNAITIPGREVETCVEVPKGGLIGLLGGTEEECTKTRIPDTKLTALTTGGAEFEWTVDKEDLYAKDYVKFYINTNPRPSSLEELSSISLEQENVILPVFLNE